MWEALVVKADALMDGTTIRFVPVSGMIEGFIWKPS
jgi:hypothetical protein